MGIVRKSHIEKVTLSVKTERGKGQKHVKISGRDSRQGKANSEFLNSVVTPIWLEQHV